MADVWEDMKICLPSMDSGVAMNSGYFWAVHTDLEHLQESEDSVVWNHVRFLVGELGVE